MSFKKDYINFVLYNVLNQPDKTPGQSVENGLRRGAGLGKLLEKIISSGDLVKIIYLVGKTAGLELLFKYLLYISDKIDKSQITIFNLKNNFDYDVQNLKKICSMIEEYRSTEAAKIEESETGVEEPEETTEEVMGTIKVETAGQVDEEISAILESKGTTVPEEETAAEEQLSDSSFTLIGHQEESVSADSDVFELPDINQPSEIEESEIVEEGAEVTASGTEPAENEEHGEREEVLDGDGGEAKMQDENLETKETQEPAEETAEPFEFEVRAPGQLEEQETGVVGEASEENTLDKLKSKFFEEIKILEKLMFHIEKDFRNIKSGKMKQSVSKRLSEITLISGELSQLTKLLGMDDISRIFFSLSLYFAKVFETPRIVKLDDLRLLLSSLDMVNIVLKGEKYSNYEQLLQKVDDLRNNLSRKPEVKQESPKKEEEQVLKETKKDAGKVIQPMESEAEKPVTAEIEQPLEEETAAKEAEYPKHMVEVPQPPSLQPPGPETKTVTELDSANFKMRYLVKDFEKNFLSLNELQDEYSKFDGLEKIDELNNLLRMIARISASAGFQDVLKLAEVSYVFLKYLKDYRMDILDPEIQQILKYIIFSFKMLLTNRKPEDFDVLVQYLNNPVKIFTDS